jgi:membrane-bound inhibitor of C-type lysozyme
LSEPTHARFKCKDGTQGIVSYYSLSDKSLRFIKLQVGGQTHTLPQAVSGSGARYSDSVAVEWFEKGDTALLNTDVGNDKSPSVSCKLTVSPTH